MERSLEEVLPVCERAHTEEKSGTRERSILSMTAKNLRKCLQDYATDLVNRKDGSAPSSLSSTPSKPSSAPNGTVSKNSAAEGDRSQEPSLTGVADSTLAAGSVAASEERDPRRRFLTSSDAVNRLAYASTVSIAGDKTAPPERAGCGGSIPRGNAKTLITSLELAAVLLNSGVVPTELWMPLPLFDLSQNASGGAHAFFSKILGGGGKAGKGTAGPSSSPGSQTPAPEVTDAAQATTTSPPSSTASVGNVRDRLVDAVLSAAPMVLAKDAVEKLVFTFIATLQAATIPRVSRARVDQLGDNAEELRFSSLSLHGSRLVRVMHILFTLFTRQGTSLVLLDEVKSVLHQIVKALSKYTELELRTQLAAGDTSTGNDASSSKPSGDSDSPGRDLVSVLEFCTAVCRVAPLTLSANPSSASSGSTEKRPTTSDDAGASVVSDASVAPFATFTTLVTSLGFILHIIVNGGHMFRRMDNVIQCIRLSVIPAAVRTSLSNETDVFRLSLNVLLTCCVTFGPHLVNETSTVFRHVYFRVLESKFTSFAHKSMVIEAFRTYIEEPQNLIALFLNYDCNTRSQSIYEEMINYLAALAQVPPRDGKGSKTRNGANASAMASPTAFADPSDSSVVVRLEYEVPEELQRKAMQTLLLVAESNIQWIERFEVDQGDSEHANSTTATSTSANTRAALATAGGNDSAVADDEGHHPANPHQQPQQAGTSGCATDVRTLEEEAGGDPAAAAAVSSSNNDTFLQARRYKDALKKFYYLFNDKGNPEGAIDYLNNCILVIEAETTGEGGASGNDAPAAPTGAAEVSPESVNGDSTAPTVPGGEETAAVVADGATPAAANSGTSDAIPAPSAAEVRQAARVARFLNENEDWLDKIALGEYFAKSFRKTSNRLVFEQWIQLYDFTGLKLDEALRLFLGGFKLLGEAQIVDRTMELFAAQYCRQNPTVFSSADTAFILSFSICMLNTDAHSSHIKNKMTVDGFIRNNKGIDEGNDVDPAILTGIYNRITGNEIVLRPSKYVSRSSAGGASDSTGADAQHRGKEASSRFSGGVLDSIPLLRHLAPIANVITDKVLLPMDAAGSTLFGGAQRKREEMYQEELRAALREVTDALRSSAALPHSAFVAATSIENALPMWEVTVDLLCRRLASSLFRFFEDSEQYISPSLAGQTGGAQNLPPDYDPVQAYMRETKSYEYFQILLRGLTNTVHVCCSFGNVTHSETLLEQAFQMTQLSQTVIMSTSPTLGPQVQVMRVIPRTRLELLVSYLNLYVNYGASFGARGWQVGYTALSLVDALANGIEGLWKRQTKRLMQRPDGGSGLSPSPSPQPASTTPTASSVASSATATAASNLGTAAYSAAPAKACPSDVWFGSVRDVPASIASDSRKYRENILNTIRVIPESAVDLWLERLFDATRFATTTQLQMANGLVKVCQKELQHHRTFTLTKLFDFVTVCASFSTRLQWRELWANASEVFVQAGKMNQEISSQALDGLRIIAMTYLMREELLNYSFQKEVLKPFEDILMSNQAIFVRRRVISIMSELIDFRAGHLASGWHVVFTCLSHAAVIPEVVGLAWEVCERVMALHADHMKDCFSDLIFCLTTFACTTVDEQVPLRGISYLVACGHWLQYGLEAPPSDVREAADVVRWASRFRTADVEARASRTLGKHLVRVTQAPEPLTQVNPLAKPGTYVVKTHYHLWMSLFEGLIPIVVVHASTRVRAHAVSSICALLRHYGAVFSCEVQDSLFKGTLRPVLATLISHVQHTGDSVVDRTDYRMLVYLALRGLVLACNMCVHLLELCCETLLWLSSSLNWSVEVVENDVVDVWVRVCCDMLAAVVTSAASTNAANNHAEPADPLQPAAVNPTAAESGSSSPLLSATQNCSFAYLDRSLQGSFSADPTAMAGATSLAWLPQPLPDKKDSNPFFLGLLHEIQQMGAVDVVHYKRTTAWTELHVATAVATVTVTLSPSLQTFSLTSLVQQTVLQCLGDGLLARLAGTATSVHGDNRALCLLFARAMRHAMLGLSFYCVVTHDVEGVLRLLDAIQPFTNPTTHIASNSGPTQPGSTSVAADGDKKGSSTQDAEVDTPIEMLLSVPYVTVLLEFIFSFPMDLADVGRRILRERVAVFLSSLASARQFCVDQQLEVQRAFEQQAAEQGSPFKPYKGKGFIDIFRCARGTIEDRVRYYTCDAPPQLRRRAFHEWKYLTYLLAMHCTLSLGRASTLGCCADTPQLFQLLALLPSELEEAAASSFSRSCWVELDLHCNMPEEATMTTCLALVQARAFASVT